METVLVTGANAGLGLALVEGFLKTRRKVYAGVRRDASNLERLHSGQDGRLVILEMDVADEESVRTAVVEIAATTDYLDVIVNNAAVLFRDTVGRSIEELNFDRLAKTMDINAYGALRVLKYALPLLYRGERRVIVNVSSEAGSISRCSRKEWYDYCMSKAAMNMSSMILQNYLDEKKVKVLAVHPGWMRTRLGGSEAPIDPAHSAAGIIALVERRWERGDPVFMDYEGKVWEW